MGCGEGQRRAGAADGACRCCSASHWSTLVARRVRAGRARSSKPEIPAPSQPRMGCASSKEAKEVPIERPAAQAKPAEKPAMVRAECRGRLSAAGPAIAAGTGRQGCHRGTTPGGAQCGAVCDRRAALWPAWHFAQTTTAAWSRARRQATAGAPAGRTACCLLRPALLLGRSVWLLGQNADARAPAPSPAPLQEARKPASRVANVLQRESEAR